MNNRILNEQSRLASLREPGIGDTPPEQRFDKFVLLARAAFAAPIALVSIHGTGVSQTTFCSHAIEADDTFIVNDAPLDVRFANDALVIDAPAIRFYAGHPIRTPDGVAVGTLCIFDTEARTLSGDQVAMLRSLARLVEDDLNKEQVLAAQQRAETALQQQNEALGREIKQRCDIEMTLRRSEECVRSMIEAQQHERLGAVAAMQDLTAPGESRKALRTITDNLPTLIGQVDRNGRFVFLNARALSFYGQPAQKLLGQPVRSVYSDAEYAKIKTHIDAAAAGRRAAFDSEIAIDGKVFHYHAWFVPNFSDSGEPNGYFAMAFDITARRESEIRRLQGEERLKTITDNVPVLISYLDSELRFQFANAMYKDWLGVATDDMIGKSVSEVFGASGFDEQADSLSRALGGHMSNVELTVHRKGRSRILSTTYMPHLRDGKTIGIYVLATDATAARAHERHLLVMASADPLTNLPNRRMYEFQLAKSLAAARRNATRLALMYLDLDDFKKINDSLGHSGGDEVLIEFGSRVSSVLRESDMLARLAGDEFTIILEAVGSGAACELVAKKILAVLQQPFVIGGRAIRVSTSIGVAFGYDGVSAEALADHADQALYAARRAGKNQFAVVSMNRHEGNMIGSAA